MAHSSNCDWHTDQYPWECNCGVIVQWADKRLGQLYASLESIADEMPAGSTEAGCLHEAMRSVELADVYVAQRLREGETRHNPHTGMAYTVLPQSTVSFAVDDDECPDCDGHGRIWNNADPTSGQWVECDTCGVSA